MAKKMTTHQTKRALTWALFVTHTWAHTWIEQAQVIGPNGSYVGEHGYTRGFVDRADSRFDGYANKWQIPDPRFDVGLTRMNDSMLACHPSQRTANYSSGYPKLQVSPGDFVAMKYLENGHVTKSWDPKGKPQLGGTVWVYATHKPKEDEKLYDVLQWNANGTAGNGEGWLMAAQDFDDGRCYQINTSAESLRRQSAFPNHPPSQPDTTAEQWCETNVLVDNKFQVNSTITIYWVWGWETGPGTRDVACGKDEYYTSCLDFKIVHSGSRGLSYPTVPSIHMLSQQDPQSEAVHIYRSRSAIRKNPIIITEGSCGDQSNTADMYIPTNIQIVTGIRSSASLTVPQQSLMQTFSNLEHKYASLEAEEQNPTISAGSTTTTTTTITAIVTPTLPVNI
jgi:hypothetical protein